MNRIVSFHAKAQVVALLLGAFWLAGLALAPDAGAAPVGAVLTAVNAATGVMTGQEQPAGRTFQFTVPEPRVRARLHKGQKVQADFDAKVVLVTLAGPGVPPLSRYAMTNIAGGPSPAVAAKPGASPAPAKPGAPRAKPEATKPTEPPDDDAAEDDEPDVKVPRGLLGPRRALRGGGPGAKLVSLDKYPDAQGFMSKVAQAIARKEINVALLGGEKYMINKCLGIKVAAGKFRLRLENPNLRIEGTGVKLTYGIDRISMTGISLRMRPSTNILKPCHFSKKFSVGGAASNIKITNSFDPILDVATCKLGSIGKIHTRVGIGGLNLKPLQNNLDKVAKNMIEDALNNFFEFNWTDQIIQTIDDILEVDCPGKKALIG